MALAHEKLDSRPSAGAIVDVDAGDVELWQRALEDDREVVAHQVRQSPIVGPRPGHDQAISASRTDDLGVRAIARRQSLNQDAVTGGASSGRDTAQCFAEQCVAGDLLGRLPQDEADRQARSSSQLPRRTVGVVVEVLRGVEDALARGRADVDVLALGQHH